MAKKSRSATRSLNARGFSSKSDQANIQEAFQPRKTELSESDMSGIHVYGKGKRCLCMTDSRGFKTYKNRSLTELWVDATNGFIPLWDRGVTLRYRFNESSIQSYFENPEEAKAQIKLLFAEAVEAWGDSCPVSFQMTEEQADFEITMMQTASCNTFGCVLASAFFPDSGRHHLRLYPTLFEQARQEQVETLCHEIGHIFGLRHFFANVEETDFPSRLFGSDNEYSIMNYGEKSVLTDKDKSDLKKLYQMAWDRELVVIDKAPIRFFQPYSSLIQTSRIPAFAAKGTENKVSVTGRDPIQIIVAGRKISIE
ncbi:MAG: matrixin family metalloprotease [Planctomycetota bacterium]|jgi:hypothetical protein